MIGKRLGPYEITAAIGAGGMGEVYRARDTRLNRDVAIKVLPAELARDHERVSRFRREAQVLASLNHPNIAAIYGLEETEGAVALAMELVEGEDLAERLRGGAIAAGDALAIAAQIAEGLEAAHEKGIIHRDLKPANIKVTPDGAVKILDFGLAKALDAETGASNGSSQISNSPTLSRNMTEAGMIMGTAAYMSPEQARGKAVDKRADIWAFGVVLFEMLSGTRLFAGETISDTLAAVLTRTPDWSTLPAATPVRVRRLLDRCLERDPKQRLRDIGEARLALAATSAPEEVSASEEKTLAAARFTAGFPFPSLTVALLLAGTAFVAGYMLRTWFGPGGEPRALSVLGVTVPPQHALTASQSPLLDISPDGRTLLFVAEGQEGLSVYRRRFDSLEATQIKGTEGAENPVLSPDGRYVAFFADKMLRRVAIEGGIPIDIAPAQAPRGLAWTRDGSLVFSPVYNSPLLRISATGGPSAPLTAFDASKAERTHRWPQVLPDGRTVIFTVGVSSSPGDYDGCDIDALNLDTGERRTILQGARMARYTSLGYLVFQRRQSLLAVRFNPGNLQTLGDPFSVQEGLGGNLSSGAGYFAVDDRGVVVAAPDRSIPKERLLALVDREGRETLLNVPPSAFNHPRFSPDGGRLAVAIGGGSGGDDEIYILDLPSQRMQRLTFGQGYAFPLWSRDGQRIFYTAGHAGDTGVRVRPSDGSGQPTTILTGTEQILPDAWLPDGRRLAITATEKSIDLQVLDHEDGTRTPLIADPVAGESAASFSPDGRYLAYTTTQTGTDEVMVETYPLGRGKWQVSEGGGSAPMWSPDGRKLYFVTGQRLMETDVNTSGVFSASTPRTLLTGPFDFYAASTRNYDVGPDGRFVLVKRPLDSKAPGQILVIESVLSLDPSLKATR